MKKTISGSVVTADLSGGKKIVSLIVPVTGSRGGSGTPSMSNVRPITPAESAVYYHSGADDSSRETVTVPLNLRTYGELYEGTADVVKGKTTFTKLCITFTGGESWISTGSGSSRYYRYNIGTTNITASTESDTAGEHTFFSHLPVKNVQSSNTVVGGRIYKSGGVGYVSVRPGTSVASNVTQFKSWLAEQHANGTPLQVVFTMTLAETVPASSAKAPVISGVNKYWADGGDTVLTYSTAEISLTDRIDWTSRYELMGEGMELEAIDTPEVEFVAGSELKISFKGRFIIPDGTDLVTTRLCPYITINGEEYPCGRYIITSAEKNYRGGIAETEITGYSVLYLAKRTVVEERLHFSAGAGYLATVRALLIASGISAIVTDTESSAVLQTDREDWDPGTPYLDIINQLLSECGYADVWPDMSGVVHLSRPSAGSAAEITHEYAEGQYSVITDPWKRSDDRYGKFNVVRLICANPDLSAPMIASAELTDPAIPYSIPNIGRVAHIENVDNVASQTELEAKAQEMIVRQMSVTETCEFYTACDPTHGCRDVTALTREGLTGIWRETGWRLPLNAAYDMTHTGERVIPA